jgi:hypothetical protein
MNGYRFSIVFTIFNFEYLQNVVFDEKSLQSQQQRHLRKKMFNIYSPSRYSAILFLFFKIANAMV